MISTFFFTKGPLKNLAATCGILNILILTYLLQAPQQHQLMITDTNRQMETGSSKRIRRMPKEYGLKSAAVISPFIRQFKMFEERASNSNRNARDRFREQSKEYKMNSASILRETKEMINQGSSVSFCNLELMRVMEENDNDRERELDLVSRIRRFRSRERGVNSTRWLETASTSIRTQKVKILESQCKPAKDKENQIPQALKTFLSYKKNPLKIKFIL